MEVLARRFGAAPEFIAEARGIIGKAARLVQPAVSLSVIKEDPDDDRILECASAAGSDYLVTGDKDLLRLGRYDSIRIVTVSDFLDIMQAQGFQR